jgi:predicted unusual protein kinase regulating ubiquinone biosynthesis (AarF/ABC1/UbiB family)
MTERLLPSGRARRTLAPAWLSARAAAGQAATWARSRFAPPDRRDEILLARAVRSAEEAVALMGQMKGALMKVGQLLSFADIPGLPPEVQEVLASLRADAPPMSYDLVRQVVTDELGAPPEEAFAWFSPRPIAAASIGQVHAAQLLAPDGRAVVVKVQYPGVAEAIEADLRNTALLSTLLSLVQTLARDLVPRLDVKALAEEVRDRVVEELDYRKEAANQHRFELLFRDHSSIRVPEVVPERSTSRVLTTAYDDGMRWEAALGQPAELRNRWGEAIFRFVFTSLYRHGLFNGDPHPGNYLFHEEDGSVAFLDFGCVREFTAEQVAELREVAQAVLDDDADRLRAALVGMGFLRPDDDLDPRVLLDYVAIDYDPIRRREVFRHTREWAEEVVARHIALAGEYRKVAWHFDVPPHVLFLGRISVGLASVLTALEAEADWRSIADEIWATSPPPATP